MLRWFGWVIWGLALLFVAALLTQTPQFKAAAAFLQPPTPARLTETLQVYPLPNRPDVYDYTPPAQGFQRFAFSFEGKTRYFWMLEDQVSAAGTATAAGTTPLPAAVLLLHGSLRDGRSMLDMWRQIAAQGAILIAPDSLDATNWAPQNDGAAFQTALLAAVMTLAPFDPARQYLYGHSSGAIHALHLGQCTDLGVQKIAIHAGSFAGCTGWARPVARPYLIQIGVHDETIPLPLVRASAQAIADAGSPVELMVIDGHNHWYYHIGPALAAQAWQFFEQGPAN